MYFPVLYVHYRCYVLWFWIIPSDKITMSAFKTRLEFGSKDVQILISSVACTVQSWVERWSQSSGRDVRCDRWRTGAFRTALYFLIRAVTHLAFKSLSLLGQCCRHPCPSSCLIIAIVTRHSHVFLPRQLCQKRVTSRFEVEKVPGNAL